MRIFLIFFIEIRLDVRFATQPLLNSIRTFAISGVSVITPTPLAEMDFTSLFTMLKIISMSWIIRSSITLTSVPRGLNCANLCTSMNMGLSCMSCTARNAGLNLSTCPTWNFIPDSSASFTNCLASSIVLANGFSTKTCLAFLIAFSQISKCWVVGAATSIAVHASINMSASRKRGS